MTDEKSKKGYITNSKPYLISIDFYCGLVGVLFSPDPRPYGSGLGVVMSIRWKDIEENRCIKIHAACKTSSRALTAWSKTSLDDGAHLGRLIVT